MEFAWPKMLQRPVLGWGTGRSVKILGWYGATLSIDNYYLNLGLELGFPGPIVFLAGFIALAATGLRWGLRDVRDPYSGLYFAFAGLAICFAITRMILSITTNIELFMVLTAAFIGAAQPQRRNRPFRSAFVSAGRGPAPLRTAEDLARWRQQVLKGGSAFAARQGFVTSQNRSRD